MYAFDVSGTVLVNRSTLVMSVIIEQNFGKVDCGLHQNSSRTSEKLVGPGTWVRGEHKFQMVPEKSLSTKDVHSTFV